MTLRVLFFSVLRDIAGAAEIHLDARPGARVEDALDELFARWPKLKEWEKSLLLAVDQNYARRDAPLHDGAELALMPPVQGG